MNPKCLCPLLALMLGCGSSTTDTHDASGDTGALSGADGGGDAGDSADTGSPPGDGGTGGDAADVRGGRYCEVLLATITGDNVHVLVYNTQGLSDCPQDAWDKLDAAAIQADTGASSVKLNGPRYWMIDSFADSKVLDPTVRTFGGIPMRQAGAIDVALADVTSMQRPYTLHTIQRDSQFVFWAGKTVFELGGPDGHVYTMQSYSVQAHAQDEATLPSLGSVLTLPAGWTFTTRTLAADLSVKAVDKKATVVTDDYKNTYLQSK